MRKLTTTVASILVASMILGGCASMNNTGKGALIGTGGGAALGAGIGAIFGKGKGAAIGAAVGGAIGAGTGVLIGRKMDKQKAELEKIEDAQIETVTDQNGLQAIKVTFDSGILFATNQTSLNAASRSSLQEFATSLINNPQTDLTIYGHTDNTGSREVNERISLQRAQSVANFLSSNGVSSSRMKTEGKAYDMPVADNSTAEGRAQNRRVEIYITANAQMIQEAQAANK